MSFLELFMPLFAYIAPILFFMYMGIDVLLRDAKKVEHRLVGILAGCYILLFLEEYFRYQLPIEYSPVLSAWWLANVGILIPGLGFHFLVRISRMDRRMPRWMYPAVFYLPCVVVVLNVIGSQKIISSHEFVQTGIWKSPVYNTPYYIALTISILISLTYLIVLFKAKRKAYTEEHQSIYRLLIVGVVLVAVWHVVFGYIHFGEHLPPYSYLYGGVIWCFILRLAMIRHDFLNFDSKRYAKLFNLNPAAILLIDLSGKIKEANPKARQWFYPISLDRVDFFTLFNEEVQTLISDRQKIVNFETMFYNDNKPIDVLMDGDYVFVDNEPHVILILRDITAQKENQKEIEFMAYHDALTRMPNRRYFYEKLEEAIRDAEEHGHRLAVILIDLDRFKEVNDQYGHEAGDEVLKLVANIIQETAAHIGMAARLGGDEFVLFIHRIPSVRFVEETMQQLQNRLAQEVLMYKHQPLKIRMSMGASYFPEDGTDGDALLNSADKAMYDVKGKGR